MAGPGRRPVRRRRPRRRGRRARCRHWRTPCGRRAATLGGAGRGGRRQPAAGRCAQLGLGPDRVDQGRAVERAAEQVVVVRRRPVRVPRLGGVRVQQVGGDQADRRVALADRGEDPGDLARTESRAAVPPSDASRSAARRGARPRDRATGARRCGRTRRRSLAISAVTAASAAGRRGRDADEGPSAAPRALVSRPAGGGEAGVLGAVVARVLGLQGAPPAGGLAVCELLADQRQHVAAVVDGVGEGVVAADRHQDAPAVDVVEDRRGDRLRASRPARSRRRRVGDRGRPGPQRPVVELGLRRRRRAPLRADVLRRARCCSRVWYGRGEGLGDLGDVLVRLVPGQLVGLRRRSGGRSPRSAAVSVRPAARAMRVDPVDLAAQVVERLAPEAEDVGLACRRPAKAASDWPPIEIGIGPS